jgi:basic amino acid/polyamine antiporter, APA family
MASLLGPRKTIEETLQATEVETHRLRRELGALDVLVLGIGVIVGAGIFVLVGEGSASAGPAVTISFAVAAVVCVLAALCYAEFAAMVPAAGSAYTFAFATLGQLVAFIIGWDLALEFIIGASAVSVGFAGYLNSLLDQVFGVTLPDAISAPPGEGGTVNVFAVAVVVLVGALLVRGVRLTARANVALVGLTVAVLVVVIGVGATQIDADNWTPYFPNDWSGVRQAAAVLFFAYIGFDIVATTAEEAREPQRDMPIGIIGSLVVVTGLYIAVAAVITGMVPFGDLDSSAPVAEAFNGKGLEWVAAFIYAGALVAILNTVMILMLGQSRVAFAMARDRLLPHGLGRTHERWGTPWLITIITVGVVAVIAAFVPLGELAKLVSIGTLFAFFVVAAGILVLRVREPERERPFRTPFAFVTAPLAMAGCVYLATDLDAATWWRFGIWMLVGIVVYFTYSVRSSRVGSSPNPSRTDA